MIRDEKKWFLNKESTIFLVFISKDVYVVSSIHAYFLIFQRHPTDKAYFIAKEILMTERTYKKDLEVINLVSEANISVL